MVLSPSRQCWLTIWLLADLTLFCEGSKVTNIYVGNLSFRATEDDIRQAFGAYGEVATVNIIVDRETGRSRGFAFVEMPNADGSQRCS